MASVIIDPGHGGTSAAGGSSPYGASANGCLEKHVNLDLSRRVAARLGSIAQLTRDGDVNLSLRDRVGVAARYGARALVSIHAGAGEVGSHGSEVWLHERHDHRSAELAEDIHASLRGVGPTRGVFRGPLALLDPGQTSGVAACLIEVDNLRDPQGRQRLTEPRAMDQLADAIAGGVRRYMARFGQPTSGIVAREVSDSGGMNQRYRSDQNIGSVPFHGYMRPSLDFVNRFIWLIWPQRRRPDDAPAAIDIDLRIDLYDRDPQTDLSATPIDTQTRRVTLSEGQKFGYEYTRLPEGLDIHLKITFTDYGPNQDAGQLLWTNGYGGGGGVSPGPQSFGRGYGDPERPARCLSRQMTVPASYDAFEAEVRDQWIATCVLSRTDNLHLERPLVNDNASLRRVWDAVGTLAIGTPFTLNAGYTTDTNGVAQAIEFSTNVTVMNFSDTPEEVYVAPTIDQAITRVLALIRARLAAGDTAYDGTSLRLLECLCVKMADPNVDHHVVKGDLYVLLDEYAPGRIGRDQVQWDFRDTFRFLHRRVTDQDLLRILATWESTARNAINYLITRKDIQGAAFPPRLVELGQWVASRMRDPNDIYSCWNY